MNPGWRILLGLLLAVPGLAQQPNDIADPRPSDAVVSAPIPVASTTVNGVLGAGSGGPCEASGTTPQRIFRDGTPSSCGAPKGWPGWFGGGSLAYDSYKLMNGTGSTQCVTISVSGLGTAVHVSAYNEDFSAALAPANYLGDSGGSIDNQQWTISVAAGQTIVLVVQENNQGGGLGGAYALTFTHLTPGCYDKYYVDDFGRTRLWLNSTSGAWRMEVLSGLNMGTYSGSSTVAVNGDLLTLTTTTAPDQAVWGSANAGTGIAAFTFRLRIGRRTYLYYLANGRGAVPI